MAFISNDELSNLRNSVSIVDVISNYIPLTQRGKNYFGVCPFHEDHSPSMSVSSEKQIYKCFSCGATGNVFTFIENYLNISFPEAIHFIAQMAGISLSSTVDTKKEAKHKKEYELMNLTSKLFQNNLNSKVGVDALEYLTKRGLDEKTIKDFGIGLSFNKDTLFHILEKKGYDENIQEDLGLIRKSENGVYDLFQNRIMFPIHNWDGECIGFTGRVYKEDEKPKYLNSKETILFKKGNILFHYHLAKEAIRLKKEVIIVEGNMDAIRMHSVGIKNCIALMGTSLTKEQVGVIKKLKANVILMFDNDEAGSTATYNDGKILEQAGINPFVVRLSGKKDPDEYIVTYGVEAINKAITSHISFLDFKMDYLKKNKNLTKSVDLAEYIKSILQDLKNNPDQILREVTLQKISNDYNISYSVLKDELEKLNPVSNIRKRTISKTDEKKKKTAIEKLEEDIVSIMVNGPNFVHIYKTKLGILPDKKYRSIANEIMYFYSNHNDSTLADFLTYVELSSLKDEIKDILNNEKNMEATEEELMELIDLLHKKLEKEEIKNLRMQIKKEYDPNKIEELVSRIVEIKKGSVENEDN